MSATANGVSDGRRGIGAVRPLRRARCLPPGMPATFHVVWIGSDGVGCDPAQLDRATAISYAQALQHRTAATGRRRGRVYEVLGADGESVWRGDPEAGEGAVHPRTAERFGDIPPQAAA